MCIIILFLINYIIILLSKLFLIQESDRGLQDRQADIDEYDRRKEAHENKAYSRDEKKDRSEKE